LDGQVGAAPEVVEVVGRLRARREEIVEEIFARVREVVPDMVSDRDVEYAAGLRATAAAGFDFILSGIEEGNGGSGSVPVEALAQAQRAARNGVSLDAVLRRYMVGQALLWDYVMEEAARTGEDGALREMLRAQASSLDRLMIDVAREHDGERERAGRSSEHRRSERLLALLAGGLDARPPVSELELGYELDAEHLGVIASGPGARDVLREIAERLDRRVLYIPRGEETVWAWLGGQHRLQLSDLDRTVAAVARDSYLSFAIGEPAHGLAGWRLTHRQAQAALVVALRRPQKLTRYADVALLASALKEEMLARALIETYLVPLGEDRGGGPVLRQTLRAYLAADRNVACAAAALGVVRRTVANRLRTIEARLGRPLHRCSAELEVALLLDELGAGIAPEISHVG
jgi:DNA-binding PucR family transcriptional regulator